MEKKRPTIEELRQKLIKMEGGAKFVKPSHRFGPAFDSAYDDEDWDNDDWDEEEDWDDDEYWDEDDDMLALRELSKRWDNVRESSSFVIPAEFDMESLFEQAAEFSKHTPLLELPEGPSRFEEIHPWLVTNKLEDVASLTLAELQRWNQFPCNHCRFDDSLMDILKSPPRSGKYRAMSQNAPFLQAVQRYLTFWMQRKQHESFRQRIWDTIDVPSAFNETLQNLRALREQLQQFESAQTPLLFQRADLLVPDVEVGFGIVFKGCHQSHYYRKDIMAAFKSVGDSQYGMDCSCQELYDEPCAHLRLLIEWMLDVLADPEEPAHELLKKRFCTPAWQFGLTQLRAQIASIPKRADADPNVTSGERLAWRINDDIKDYRKDLIEPILQSRSKNGRWTKGRRIDDSEWNMQRMQHLLRENPLVLDYLHILRQRQYSYDAMASPPMGDILMRLANEPRVYLNGKKNTPVQVVCEKITFSVAPKEHGVQTSIRLGELELKGKEIGDRLITPLHLFDVDLAQGTFTIGKVSDQTYPFVYFCARNPHELPAEATSDLLALMATAEDADVWVHPSLRGKSVAPDQRIVARIHPEDEFDFRLSLHVYPAGGGAAYVPGSGPKELIREKDGTRIFVERDLLGEVASARCVADALALPLDASDAGFSWHIDTPERVLDVLGGLNEMTDVVVEWPKGATQLKVLRAGTPSLKVTARQKQNWFLIGGNVTVDDKEVSFRELLAAVRKRQRYVRLGKREYLILQKDLYQKLAVIGGLGDSDVKGSVSVPSSGIPFMDEQLEELSFHGGDGWNSVKERMAEATAMAPKVPAGFNGTLRSYQRDGFQWLARLSHWANGACLADDMGLGKTLQTLALLLWKKRTGPCLVVSPMSVCHNWIDEAAVFGPTLDVRLYHGVNREEALHQITDKTVLVTSYDTLAANVEQLTKLPFDVLILDEAQMIKNALSKRAKAVANVKAEFRLALTGTPVENHLGDLWSIFHATIPGLLGTFDQFRRQYAVPIERDANPHARELLKQLIGPFLLRRNKSAVLPDLPPRIETIAEVELHDTHMALYNEERNRILESLLQVDATQGQKRFSALAGLTKLRRLACHPRLVDDKTSVGSAKMERVLEVIQDLVTQDQRALVFSQFTSHLDLLQEELKRIGVGYLYLDGGTPQQTRKALVAKWHETKAPLFVISLKAGGFGLNLTGADYVLHLDPWWNPAAEDQATDRTHRIGQDKPVTVVRFIADDTVEQGVVALHKQKRELAESILDSAGNHKQLSPDELISLIRGA
ncbi:MAG: DEAD/DEAH box helicase family protein [Deltaproteobacteria bacterium]|nr:DEAD/DEAH box helicase family protein [Deltaproteobacteria bacterium]